MHRLIATLLVAGALSGAGRVNAAPKRSRAALPSGAAEIISKVAALAESRDFASLRKLMADDFVWSFGDDDGADYAIQEWRRDERYLTALRRVLKMRCRPDDYRGTPGVECPGRGGLTFRAWFVESPAGWKFQAFVEGD